MDVMRTYRELHPRFGQVYMARLDGPDSVQGGIRPVMIFQNNTGNRHSPNVMVVPMTSKRKKPFQPTHVFLDGAECGLKCDSILLCENPQTIPKRALGGYLTTIPSHYMPEIARASLLASGAICFLPPAMIPDLLTCAKRLNTP